MKVVHDFPSAREPISTMTRTTAPGEEQGVEHVNSSFEFVIRAPLVKVAPLFGPNREREWSPEWNPQFLYPLVHEDCAGSVFTIRHGDRTSIWVTSILDLEAGHVQYVAFLPEGMVTLIDLRLQDAEAGTSRAMVRYERMALTPGMNEYVRRCRRTDSSMGPHWERAVNGLLRDGTHPGHENLSERLL